MSDYSQVVDFSVKDGLLSGNPQKLGKGADVDGELSAISVAIASKANKVSGGTSGNVATLNSSGDLVDGGVSTTNLLRRNALINGAMNVWQRGTSFAAIADGAYSADRWKYHKVGAMVHTLSLSTDTPTAAEAGRAFAHSLRATLTTADNSIAAGDHCFITQLIEGYNFQPLAEQPMVLSFWVKASLIGTYCVSLRNSGVDRSYVGTFTVDVANTWEQKTVTILASPSGTWDYHSGVGLRVSIALAAGSTFHTTPGTWQTGSFLATSGQVNGVASGATDFRITGVQLESGTAKTPFEFSYFQDDLALCNWYYNKTFQYSQAPVQASGTYSGALAVSTEELDASVTGQWRYPRMRATPTLTTYNPTQAAATWRNNSDTVNGTATPIFVGDTSTAISVGGGFATTWYIHLAVDAEL